MDPRVSPQKRRGMAELGRAEPSRRALLSVSLVCCSFLLFLVSLSSWLPTLLHRGDYYLQDFPLPLVHLPDWLQVDRKTMFLVCNVILWIVFRDSGLLGSHNPPQEGGPCGDLPARREGPPQAKPAPGSAGSLQVSVQGNGSDFVGETEKKGGEEEEAGEGEEEEEEEDGYEEDMDELNKRFEDFIQKVKRERTLEALQLVPV